MRVIYQSGSEALRKLSILIGRNVGGGGFASPAMIELLKEDQGRKYAHELPAMSL